MGSSINRTRLDRLYQLLQDPAWGMHSFLIMQDGNIISEAYWEPYGPEKPHTLFSASKTFTSLAVGFALQDGLLSLDDTVVSFFPERLPSAPGEMMQRMTVRNLLMMSTGFARDPHDFPWPRTDDILALGPHCSHGGQEIPKIDWIRNFFDHYVAYEPGSAFAYCTHGTYMLSCIVQKVTGRTTSDYMNEKLFKPLGIGEPFWEEGPDGCTVGGWGLMLTTRELARVGQFLLQKGEWEGKQLLNREYIREAVSVQITFDHLQEPYMAGYGYQVWVEKRRGAFLMKGAFNQVCAVIPDQNMVIAYTGGLQNGKTRNQLWGKIWELAVETADEKNIGSDRRSEKEELRSYRIQPVQGSPSSQEPKACRYSGHRYILGDNRLRFTSIRMDFAEREDEADQLTLGLDGCEFTVPVGYDRWLRGSTCVKTEDTDTDVSIIFENVSCSGAWRDGIYHMILCFDETSYINDLSLDYRGGGVIINHKRNCSFFEAATAMLTGVEE